jgi:ribosomal protein S18 acetylase RimI-like enzyme
MSRESPAIRIVPAVAGHREFVRRLSAEVFDRFGDYGTMLPRMMGLPWMVTAVAEVDGDPVAFAIYSLEDRSRGEIDLAAIAVRRGWESRGVGRSLLDHVQGEARRLAPAGTRAAVRLTVAEDNRRARRVFSRAGFEPVPGEAGLYPAGQRSLTLRKELSAEKLDPGGTRQKLE